MNGFGGDLVALVGISGFLSSNSVPTMLGICWFCHSAKLRQYILYYFVRWNPQILPMILYHVTKVKMACSQGTQEVFYKFVIIH
jgi:hypothetical protein